MEAKGFKTSGSFPGASWSSILSDPARESFPGLQLLPKARAPIALIPRHLPTIRPASLLGQRNPQTALLRLAAVCVPRGCKVEDSLCPLPCTLSNSFGVGLYSGAPFILAHGPPSPPAGPWAPSVPGNPPRIFPTCLGGVSLRPVDEQTEAEGSPQKR